MPVQWTARDQVRASKARYAAYRIENGMVIEREPGNGSRHQVRLNDAEVEVLRVISSEPSPYMTPDHLSQLRSISE